jgi:nitrite reductase/ring-hydroxylating ferredoxin subunit
MINTELKAKSIGIDRTEVVPSCEIVERVKHGEVIIVSRCLQSIGYFECLQETSLRAIERVVGQEKADKVKQEGFEAIHTIIDIDQLESIVNTSYEVFHALAPTLAKQIVQSIFQVKTPFYFEEYPNVRFHVPYDVVVKKIEEFSQFYWNGKVTAHGPHHDSWYYCPTNCINVWIALGSVTVGNGLTLYPQVYGKRLPCTKDGKILHNQYFGRSLKFELEPGDAILFRGEHLHGSEINCTPATRYVVSLRMTLEKPRFLGRSPYQEDYIYAKIQDKPLPKLNQFLINTARILKKRIKSILNRGKSLNYIISPSEHRVFDDTSANFPQMLLIEKIEPKLSQKLAFNPLDLPIGTIKPISGQWCIVRLDDQQAVVFSRYCPHEGADLAGGYLREDCVVCPWHNLPFSFNNGASPCQSLARLEVSRYIASNQKQEQWQSMAL